METLSADSTTILRGWEEAGLLAVWGPNQSKLYEEAVQLNAKGHLFPSVNDSSTHITASANLPPQGEGVGWEDCHSDAEEDSDGELVNSWRAWQG